MPEVKVVKRAAENRSQMNRRGALGILASLVAVFTGGCGRDEAAVPTESQVTSQTAPKITPTPDQRLVAVFLSPLYRQEFKDALTNKVAHQHLTDIYFTRSGDGKATTYNRHTLSSTNRIAGKHAVMILQRALNDAYEPTKRVLKDLIEKEHAAGNTRRVTDLNDLFVHARTPIEVDGDFGQQSHRLRAFISLVREAHRDFSVRMHEKTPPAIPFIPLDETSNNTAIGPQTMTDLCRHSKILELFLTSSHEVIMASYEEARRINVERPVTSNTPRRLASMQ